MELSSTSSTFAESWEADDRTLGNEVSKGFENVQVLSGSQHARNPGVQRAPVAENEYWVFCENDDPRFCMQKDGDSDFWVVLDERDQHTEHKVTFQPSRAGLIVKPTGIVREVHKGCQADQLGVRDGWVVKKVNDTDFTEESLRTAIASGVPYTLVFQCSWN